MRNVFDQYAQPENRVTHALMTALAEDRALLRSFLRELVRVQPPAAGNKLQVLEQQYPGEAEPSEEELERKGVPDGWIFDNNGWCVFIETKVLAKLTAAQIRRHRQTALRRGFGTVTAVAIAPVLPASPPPDTVFLEWRRVYAWLRAHSRGSPWAARAADYLEIAEAKLIESKRFMEGTLTMFAGFPFGHEYPFTYLEAKRVLGLALGELRGRRDLKRRLHMDPRVPGRSAITGRQSDGVWDFLSLSSVSDGSTFTHHPHLTLGITASAIEAMVTVPNAVNSTMRRNLKTLGEDGFRELTKKVLQGMKPLLRRHEGAAPWFRGIQRRYPSQRSKPFVDARIDFDLRTAVPSGEPKVQPRWLSAAYDSFVSKEGSNYQIQMGMIFPYDRCPELRKAASIELVAKAWLACEPLVSIGRRTRGQR